MADPLTLTLVTTAISGAVSAGSSIAQGDAAKSQYNYKAGVGLVNKQIAEQNRDYSFATGGVESQRFGVQAAQRMGQIKVAQSASGADVTSGSAKMVQDSQSASDVTTEGQIRANAARRAYGYEIAATGFDEEAKMDRIGADTAKTSGEIGAVSSLLSTASGVASKWYQGTQSGMFGSGNTGTDPWAGLR